MLQLSCLAAYAFRKKVPIWQVLNKGVLNRDTNTLFDQCISGGAGANTTIKLANPLLIGVFHYKRYVAERDDNAEDRCVFLANWDDLVRSFSFIRYKR